MSLGWGLRGFIGGGPLGAMIPGAMIGLVLCLLLGRSARQATVVAALAAVGIGFGGQMTYGNTIQLAVAEQTRWWGLLGLTVKGGAWGLLGGAVIGLALERGRVSWPGLAAMIAGTWVGWQFVNVPRLIYFSIDRQELWAGMLLGALALLAVERSRLAAMFALVTLVGGAAGFGFGGWLQVWGRWNAPHPVVGWWKVMEFTFGAGLGLALGWVAWRWRPAEPDTDDTDYRWLADALARLAVAGALYLEYTTKFRFTFTLLGAGLIGMVNLWPRTAGVVALTMTIAAFVWDLTHRPDAVALALIFAHFGRLGLGVLSQFLILTWLANLVATAKAVTRGEFHGEHAMFLLLGAAVSALAWQVQREAAPSLQTKRT